MRCHSCLGNKRIMGLGWMEVECPTCKGRGEAIHHVAKLSDTELTGSVLRVDEAVSSEDSLSGSAEPFTSENVARGTRRERRGARV